MVQSPYVQSVCIAGSEDLYGLIDMRNRRVEVDQLLSVAVGQRVQQNCLNQAIDRCGGSDAERERDDGDRGEAGIAAELARGIAEVRGDAIDEWRSRLDTIGLLLLSKAAEAQARLALGRFRVHALRAELGSRHLKVRRELIVDIDIGPAISSTEEASEDCAKRHSHFLLLRLEEAAHDSGDALPAFGCTDELPAPARSDGVEASAAVVL
jgi:hypothetical protein